MCVYRGLFTALRSILPHTVLADASRPRLVAFVGRNAGAEMLYALISPLSITTPSTPVCLLVF